MFFLINILSMILVFFLVFLFIMLSEISSMNQQKMKEFECGFNLLNNNRLSFSTQYFLISILFLIFDLEIVLIIPIMKENFKMLSEINFINFLILILILGLFMEWIFNAIEWSK